MPRSARASAGGYCYHVINRGNARAEVIHKDEVFEAFVRIMGEARVRVPMHVVSRCLKPNISISCSGPVPTATWAGGCADSLPRTSDALYVTTAIATATGKAIQGRDSSAGWPPACRRPLRGRGWSDGLNHSKAGVPGCRGS